MGGLLIDWIVQWSVPRTFLDSVRCRGKSGNSRVSPILKTLGTRSHLLWSLPKLARVAHHSEECFVFGFAGVHCFEEFLIAERFRFSGISELTSPWDSLLSCVYNVQYFFAFVNTVCALFTVQTNANRFPSSIYTFVLLLFCCS